MAVRSLASHPLSTVFRAALAQSRPPMRSPLLLPAGRGLVTAEDLKPPRMPEQHECCGNGCDSCVWDVYFKAHTHYKRRAREQSATRAAHEERKPTRTTMITAPPSKTIPRN